MKDPIKNFLKSMKDYSIMTFDLAGCFMKTETGNHVLEDILNVEAEKFRPIGLDYIEGYENINTNPKLGERKGAFVGCIGGLALDFLSYGLIPAGFLLYDIGRSWYLNNKEKNISK